MRARIIHCVFYSCAICAFTVSASAYAVTNGAEQLGMVTSTRNVMYQGYQLPIKAYIYNLAPSGSNSLNYSVLATYPGSLPNPPAVSGTKTADGGASYNQVNFTLDTSSLVGANSLTISANDTAAPPTSGAFPTSVTASGSIYVFTHAKPAFLINGKANPLSATQLPYPTEPGPETSASVTSEGVATLANPQLIGDPPPGITAGEMDLDSIVPIGDPEISITLQPFIDLPPDDPADAPPDIINIDATTPGTYFTQFQLNYSDEQDIPGAYAPGSEQAYFGVLAVVDGTGPDQTVDVYIDVPEPAAASMFAGAGLLLRRNRKQ